MLISANEERLARYQVAAEAWADLWPEVQRQIGGLSLLEAHRLMTSRAEGVLPFEPSRRAES
jgi:3-oxoacyl-ACP reductase-like protein